MKMAKPGDIIISLLSMYNTGYLFYIYYYSYIKFNISIQCKLSGCKDKAGT